MGPKDMRWCLTPGARHAGAERPGDPGPLAGDSGSRPGQAFEHANVDGGNYDHFSRREGSVMRARVGDTLVVPGSQTRTGVILRVVGQNGAPPYVVKWLAGDHIAMVTPDQYSRIVAVSDDRAEQSLDGQ